MNGTINTKIEGTLQVNNAPMKQTAVMKQKPHVLIKIKITSSTCCFWEIFGFVVSIWEDCM